MIYDNTIFGKYIRLRSIVPEDAPATLAMRQDKEKTKYLHPVDNDIRKQIKWIEMQNKREGDYLFLAISNKSDSPVGMFGIDSTEGRIGHAGRLLMFGNPLESMEINILVFRFAFEYLRVDLLEGEVDSRNSSAIRIDKEFGFILQEPVYDEELDRMAHSCSLAKADFYRRLEKINKMVYRRDIIPAMPWDEKRS